MALSAVMLRAIAQHAVVLTCIDPRARALPSLGNGSISHLSFDLRFDDILRVSDPGQAATVCY
eukprot:11201144-Lingulodinium_polyedra.AAC.1